MRPLRELLIGAAILGTAGALAWRLAAAPPAQVEIAGWATSLAGRTRSQRHNARLSAQELDGAVVPPQAAFSFNRRVRTWSADQGYVKAPVSYDGELVRAFGGGVCQTSTTLYNAALLAGLPILERHPHVFVPRYAAPGRDAAVAQRSIDLRFRNPFPWPLRIRARVQGDRLEVRLFGARRPPWRVQVATRILDRTDPDRLTRVARGAGRAYLRSPGVPGFRAATTRIFSQGGRELRREPLGDDTYQSMNRVVLVADSQ